MISYYQNKKVTSICFSQEDGTIISTSTIYLRVISIYQKNIRNNSNILISFKQTLRDIILLFHDIAGLDMSLEEWKQLCRKTWENDYDYLQINRFAKIGKCGYTIRKSNKTTYTECTPETKPF